MDIDRRQVRIFMAVALIVLIGCAVAIGFWGTRPIDWDAIQSASRTIIIISCTIAAGVVVCLLLWVHDYEWWGHAKGSIVYIGMGALLSVSGAIFELFAMLAPLF